MIGILIVPTGIGAEIGGHAGDGNPVCKLLASCCDTLITHPNVVNASDINEMPENVLYVEGSILDKFLMGNINLEPVRTYNKILLVCNKPITNQTINAVNAARHTIGADIEILGLDVPLIMEATVNPEGCATGNITGIKSLKKQIEPISFDALAIHTPIKVNRDIALKYYKEGGLNPWGGVEAKASKLIADLINKPVAHAPLESVKPEDKELYFIFEQTVKPRIAAEAISNCYLHCVLKGLHKSPKTIRSGIPGNQNLITIRDIDFIVSPYGCWGSPHVSCQGGRIPVIMVKENKTYLNYRPQGVVELDNYWEAAGYITSLKAGICPQSVRAN